MPLIGVSLSNIHPDATWPLWALVGYICIMGGFVYIVVRMFVEDWLNARAFKKLQKQLEERVK